MARPSDWTESRPRVAPGHAAGPAAQRRDATRQSRVSDATHRAEQSGNHADEVDRASRGSMRSSPTSRRSDNRVLVACIAVGVATMAYGILGFVENAEFTTPLPTLRRMAITDRGQRSARALGHARRRRAHDADSAAPAASRARRADSVGCRDRIHCVGIRWPEPRCAAGEPDGTSDRLPRIGTRHPGSSMAARRGCHLAPRSARQRAWRVLS